ncbi:MAG: signal peptidase [Frankiaceae bacterium]|jgi:signal peptidase I|nr:signal peptidase [Frankiaceae bacterium]
MGTDGVASDRVENASVAPRKRKRLGFWQELPLLIALAVVLAVLIKTFAFQAFVIPSASMESTIMTWDRVMTNKLVYDFRDPHRGEVVVFKRTGGWPELSKPTMPTNPVKRAFKRFGQFVGLAPSGTDFIKRVVGLPGDVVSCCDASDHFLINGQPLDETAYTQGVNTTSSLRLSFTSVTVPKGQLLVMGDNRGDSRDGREFGTIPIDSVVGRAVLVMWPASHWKGLRVPTAVEKFSAPATSALPVAGGLGLVFPIALVRSRRRGRLVRAS